VILVVLVELKFNIAFCPQVVVCATGVSEQFGWIMVCTSLHELLQVYPDGVPSLPSHSSVGESDARGIIVPPTRIPFLPSVPAVPGLFGLSLIPSPHLAT